jgi:hypothetical protein
MYENALEIVLLNKDPNQFVYYSKIFRNVVVNSRASESHIRHIVDLGTPMTPTFLEIVRNFNPDVYEKALTNPTYVSQKLNSTGKDLKKILKLKEEVASKEPIIEEEEDIPYSENKELEQTLLQLDEAMVQEEIDALESAKQLQGPNDPLMISEKIVNPTIISTDVIHSVEREYSPEQTKKIINKELVSTPQVPISSKTSVVSQGSDSSSFPSFHESQFSSHDTELNTNDSRAYFPTAQEVTNNAKVNNQVIDTNGTIDGLNNDAVNFATSEVKDEHAPKYHLNSILFYFGSTTKPDWDLELEANVYNNAKLKKEEIIKFSDSVIANYGSILFVYIRKSDTIQEFHELIQLQFCYLRNLARGTRTKMAMVPISSLTNFANKLNGGSTNDQLRNDFVEPLDSVSQAGDNNVQDTVISNPQNTQTIQSTQVQIAPNVCSRCIYT